MFSHDGFEMLLGDADWDRQHHEFHILFQRLEDIETNMIRGRRNGETESEEELTEAFCDVLGETLGAMIQHSLWEERLMRNLPHDAETTALCDAHRQDHFNTATRISLLVGRLQEEGLQASVTDFGKIMMEWLVAHIERYDLPLRDLLLANGWTANATDAELAESGGG